MRRLFARGSWICMFLTFLLFSIGVVDARELPPELRAHEVGTFAVMNGGALPPAASRPLTLSVEAGARSFVLDLVPRGKPASRARYLDVDGVREENLESKLFVGHVRGEIASRARVVLVGDSFVAVVNLGSGEEIWAEPMQRFDDQASPQMLLTYRTSDIDKELLSDAGDCGYIAPQAHATARSLVGTQNTIGPVDGSTGHFLADAEVKRLKVAVVGEFEYADAFPTEQAARDDLNALMELVGDVYMSDLGISVEADVDVVTDPADPYFPIASTSTSGDILAMVGNYRIQEVPLGVGYSYAVAHLAKNTPASTGGTIGSTSVQICKSSGGTWWNAQLDKSMFTRLNLVAHELGHNCGAGHDNNATHCPGTLYEAGGLGSDQHIMQSSPGYADSSTFSTCSHFAVNNRIYSSTQPTGCLAPVTCGDASGNGAVLASDALLAQQLAGCSGCALNGLADVVPQPTPNQLVQTNDAEAILQMAVGSLAIPTNCGQPRCVCGDGILGCHEECDDGNLSNLDGCTMYCQLE